MGSLRFVALAITACMLACGGLLGDDFEEAKDVGPGADASAVEGGDDGSASADGGSVADGGVLDTGVGCDRDAAFGKPTSFANVNTDQDESNAVLSPDELELYLVRGAFGTPSDRDVYYAKRASPNDPFGAFTKLGADVNHAGIEEDNASVSADGLTLVYHSTRNGGYDVFLATRTTKTNDFDGSALVFAAGSNADEQDPYLLPDRNYIFFGRSPNNNNFDIAYLTNQSDMFTGPQYVTALNNGFNQSQPVVRRDLGEMFYDSDESGRLAVWHATNPSGLPGEFANPTHVVTLDGPGASIDVPTWLSDDGCVLLLSSDRSGGAGGRDIYIARRP